MALSDADSFLSGLWGGKSDALFYTGLATVTAAALLFVTFNRRASGASTKTATPRKPIPRSGNMPPKVGTVKVSKIFVHPIKSCRGTSVESARYTPQGVENDRKWCVLDAEKNQILTAREVPKLVLVKPLIQVDESSPEGGSLIVTFPEDSGCESFAIPLRPNKEILSTWTLLTDVTIWPGYAPIDGYICQSSTGDASSPSDILSRYIGKPVHLLYKGPLPRSIDATYEFPDLKATAHFQDMYPLLVCSEENAQAVEDQIKPLVGTQGIDQRWEDGKILIERFRPNIVLKGAGAFAEDGWEEISFGSEAAPSITLVSKCARCLLPNVDPETGVRDAAVPYKVIMKFRKGIDPIEKMKPCIGCNGVPETDGEVKVGDDVYVKKMW